MKKKSPSQLNDERVFRNADHFVVKVYQDHWNCVHTEEVKTLETAFEVIKQFEQTRCLLYAVTAQGRFATFGANDFEYLKTL